VSWFEGGSCGPISLEVPSLIREPSAGCCDFQARIKHDPGKSLEVGVKRTIKPHSEGLTVEVAEIGDQQEGLLSEFQACQEGRCSCPTNEYEKLESLEIGKSPQGISLRLKAKAGQVFDSEEIEKCLDHADNKLNPNR
jgi:hypothetical protein